MLPIDAVDEREIALPVEGGESAGDLVVPDDAFGIVVFAHGSGSSRRSPRDRQVAGALQRAGLATLLFDLLTPAEERADARTGELRFDITFLARRLRQAIDWVRAQPELVRLPLGLFGASTGASAAFVAAAGDPDVRGIVSRGGRPDLAGEALRRVTAPVLLLVGSLDEPVIDMNRSALNELASAEKDLVIVPGATHLFEEPGKLEEVARLAGDAFGRWLASAA